MFEDNEKNPSLLVDLKNYRHHARRVARRKFFKELGDDLVFVGCTVLIMLTLFSFIPVQ